MKRIKKKVKYLKKAWVIQSLVPADLIEFHYWPFSFFRAAEVLEKKKLVEPEREWNLKPKEKKADEVKLDNALKQAFKISLNIFFDKEYDEIKKDEMLYNILLAEIYALTYNLTPAQKYYNPTQNISKKYAELIAVKATTLHIEPYAFYADISKELPELQNPKRYDFNNCILSVGWENQRQEIEKQNREYKKQVSKSRKR